MFYKRILLSALVLVAWTQVMDAKKFEFIDANFEDFVNRVLTMEQERTEFKVYYSTLSKKIQEADEGKKRATYRYLYDLAMSRLQEKHTDWYEEMKPFVTDPKLTLDEQLDDARKIIKFFLTRYGAFEEFNNLKQLVKEKEAEQASGVKVASGTGLWDSLTSYVSSATNKVAGWFGFGSEQKIA